VGERLIRVVGLGAPSDVGGFVLGLSVSGEIARGINDANDCLLCLGIRLS